MDDAKALAELNLRFIEACRQGSWPMLQPILSGSFVYLDGVTGEVWDMDRYINDLREDPAPDLVIDEVRIHVAGDAAIVSARSRRPGRTKRYLDTYERRGGEWHCVHACVWPLMDHTDAAGSPEQTVAAQGKWAPELIESSVASSPAGGTHIVGGSAVR